MGDASQRFPRAWGICIVFGVSWTLVVFALIAGEQWRAGIHYPMWVLPGAPSALAGFFALFTFLALAVSRFYSLEVSPTGLHVRASFGRPLEIAWDAIQAVDLKYLLGLPVLRVHYTGAVKPAALPLWLSDPTGFRAAVTRYAGDDHTLARWLIEHPRAGRFRFL